MCGIIGYVGRRPCERLLFEGLRKLEYRGYDSAGMAWREGDIAHCVKTVGNLDSLEAALALPRGINRAGAVATEAVSVGIGHTRWATHGGVTERNAHPHEDASGRFRIVLNGIIENHLELRDRLAADLITLRSDTDAEVVAHLIGLNYAGDLADAVRRSLDDLEGHYALVAMCEDEPGVLVGARLECPLVVGLGNHEQYIASSISAFLAHTREVAVLRDGEIAVLRPDEVMVFDAKGLPHPPVWTEVEWDEDGCEKEGFETFMLKEIHEQGTAVKDTLAQWRSDAELGIGGLDPDRLRQVNRIIVVACGTSYHAGLAARNAIERWARIPVDVEVASEFRYREPIVERGAIVLGISQSGETADTLAAMRLARAQGATVIAVTNAPASQATRDSDAVLFTRAGLEIGVAATKTFVSQVVLLYELAIRLAAITGSQTGATLAHLEAAIGELPDMVEHVVTSVDEPIRELAGRLAMRPFFLYLGRLSGLPVALEGALKLKEISYIPTDAYAAGEMKHGPIALLGPETPVVCVATDRRVLPKLLSNLSEVRARGAQVLAIAGEGCKEIAEHAEHVIYVPDTDPLLQVVLSIIPLQLFAYHIARARGLNVDQPRNLAKTVTVE